MGHLRKVALLVLVVCTAALASCQSTPHRDLVGSWRNWDSGFYIVFSEELWTMIDGTYRVISDDEVHIDIDHEQSGGFRYLIEGDVLQLTNDSGTRMVFQKEKQQSERKRVRRLWAIA